MVAACASSTHPDDPLNCLDPGELPAREVPDDCVRLQVRAASINHHDIWSLRGAELPDERLPMILGCDAAGVTDDGREVIVRALMGDSDWREDETLEPRRTLLSELRPGTFAE